MADQFKDDQNFTFEATTEEVEPLVVEKLLAKKHTKYSRKEVSKFFYKEYQKIRHTNDQNIMSLANAMVSSNRPVSVLTYKILEPIIASDENYPEKRALNSKQYKLFLKTISNPKNKVFEVVHPYQKEGKIPMIVRIKAPFLRKFIECTPAQERELLRACEAFRNNRLPKKLIPPASSPPSSVSPVAPPTILEIKVGNNAPVGPSLIDYPTDESFKAEAARLRAAYGEQKVPPWLDSALTLKDQGLTKAPPSKTMVEDEYGNEVEVITADLKTVMEKEDCTVLGEKSTAINYLDYFDDEEIPAVINRLKSGN